MIETQPPFKPIQRNANQPNYFLNNIYRWGQMAKWPIEWVKYTWSPRGSPSGILRRISEAADVGIQKAKTGNIPVVNLAPGLNAELNRTLAQRGIGSETHERRLEIGEVANLGNLATDPESTLVPRLQDRVDATNWQERQKLLQEKLKDKLAVFTALCQMRDRAGIIDPNNLKIMNLVKQATEGSTPPSVWDLFTNHYELSFFQKLFAGWFYWIYYMTSLITNSIDAYLGSFINQVTEKLTTESDATRQKVFREIVEQTNDFLVQDFHATEKFAEGLEPGLLRQIQDRAIESHYGFSLQGLCESFSAFIVENDRPPNIAFFKELQEIPVIGIAFSLFEYVINRFVIQRTMKNSILPMVLEQAVNKGLEATQPDKLPFSIALTKFFNAQLERLRIVVENDEGSSQTNDKHFPGTQMLPQTIRLLIQALELEGDQKTPEELKNKIKQLREKKGFFGSLFDLDGIIREGIEKGVIGSVNKLFWELNRSARSHELFAKLMELTLAPFSDEGKTEEILRAEYEEERNKFNRTAASVFKSLVRKEVSKIFKRENSEQAAEKSKESLCTQKILVHELIEKMSAVCARIEGKIALSRDAPTETNNVQTDVAELLQILQVLGSRKELQNENDLFDPVHQNEIRNRLAPLYEKAEKILGHLLHLQDNQHQYASHHCVLTYLTETKALLTTIQDEFHIQPRLLQNPLIQSLKRNLDEITKTLGADAPIPIHLREIQNKIALHSTTIAKEQSIIDAIQTLYPPLKESQGLIDQLLLFQQGHPIQGFRPRDCLVKIAENLACFPTDEQSQHEKRELQRIIGDGSNIQGKLAELGAMLQSIHARHSQIKIQEKAQLDRRLNQARKWIGEKIAIYQHIKIQNYKKMVEETNEISSNMKTLRKKADKISASLTIPISNGILKTMAAASPILGTYLGLPVAGPLLGAVGGMGLKFLGGAKNGENDSLLRSTAKKISKIGFGFALSNYAPSFLADNLGAVADYVPGWIINKLPSLPILQQGANVAAGVLAGSTVVDWGKSATEEKVFNKVWDTLNKAYDLSLDPRVYKAFTTRAMKTISNTA